MPSVQSAHVREYAGCVCESTLFWSERSEKRTFFEKKCFSSWLVHEKAVLLLIILQPNRKLKITYV